MRYDFQCRKCAKQYEVSYPLSEDGKQVPCPKCGKSMKKVLSAVRFRIK